MATSLEERTQQLAQKESQLCCLQEDLEGLNEAMEQNDEQFKGKFPIETTAKLYIHNRYLLFLLLMSL